mmetsp:Transcript_12353/g.35313  ORF Transcript_12353/g.35313 Transcript_12353/m.35313 type:complete len:385 (-) Transcript_12353:221-1375(-)
MKVRYLERRAVGRAHGTDALLVEGRSLATAAAVGWLAIFPSSVWVTASSTSATISVVIPVVLGVLGQEVAKLTRHLPTGAILGNPLAEGNVEGLEVDLLLVLVALLIVHVVVELFVEVLLFLIEAAGEHPTTSSTGIVVLVLLDFSKGTVKAGRTAHAASTPSAKFFLLPLGQLGLGGGALLDAHLSEVAIIDAIPAVGIEGLDALVVPHGVLDQVLPLALLLVVAARPTKEAGGLGGTGPTASPPTAASAGRRAACPRSGNGSGGIELAVAVAVTVTVAIVVVFVLRLVVAVEVLVEVVIPVDLVVQVVVVVVIVAVVISAATRTNMWTGASLVGAVGILREGDRISRIRGANVRLKFGGLGLQAAASPLGVALLEHGPTALG